MGARRAGDVGGRDHHLGQLYRDRGDCENAFDELKNQWGWGGFTTHDLARCWLMARIVALAYNWWTLFGRLADPDRHREGNHQPAAHDARHRAAHRACRPHHPDHHQHPRRSCRVRRAYRRIAAFFDGLRSTAEQLSPLHGCTAFSSEAMKKFLRGHNCARRHSA